MQLKVKTNQKDIFVKRELSPQGFIVATAKDGSKYRSTGIKTVDKGTIYDHHIDKYFVPMSNEITTKDMLNANRNVNGFSAAYQAGLKDEAKVIDGLKADGYDVQPSTRDENRLEDIDCWIDGKSFSIKAEHKGLDYGNIYFELENQITATGEWVKDGWYYTGKAEFYLIYQGNEVRSTLR